MRDVRILIEAEYPDCCVAVVNYSSSSSNPYPPLAHPLSSTFPSSQLHARSFCFPRFTFDPFFSFALDVLRWADTCILVSSLRRSIFAKGTYLKLTFRESRALFGAPFFLSPAFSPSTLVFCRLFTSLSFSLSLFRPFPSSLRNESCIRFFRSTILIPVANFPFLSPSLSFSLYFSVFFFTCPNASHLRLSPQNYSSSFLPTSVSLSPYFLSPPSSFPLSLAP